MKPDNLQLFAIEAHVTQSREMTAVTDDDWWVA